MADTVPDSTSSTVTVAVNSSVAGTIETTYDEDWYKVALTANVIYTIRLMGIGTGANTLDDPLIDGIYNSSGNYVSGFNNDGLISGPNGRDAMTTFVPASSGNYWIAATGDLGSTGTFTLSVTNSTGGTDNVLATTATTASVTVGGAAVTGTIDNATDVDWFRVALTGGTTYTIRVRGLVSGNGTLADPVLAGVYDSGGNYIANTYVDDLTTRDAALTFVAPSTGNFYIAADGWSTYTGTYTVDVAASANDVPGNTTSTATLAIGSNATVVMEQPYDHDWYAVTLTAGRTYQFTMSGTGTNNTPVMHGIFNSSGTYVGGYAGTVLGPLSASASTIFTPTASGTYYIDAFSIYEGTYTLSAAQVADDVPSNTTTTASVAVGGSVTGDIGGATDIDQYAVTLAAGNTYLIKMQGAQSGKGTLEDTMIDGIYDANGVIIPNTFADDTDGREASLIFRPTATGTYYIAADGYSGYTGTYTLNVSTIPGDVGQTTSTAASVALNTPTVVTIDDAADVDWYGVTLTGGSTYGIRLQGTATKRGTLVDPVLLGVYDSNGSLVPNTFVDDAGVPLNAKLMFTPATTGTYYIAADGYDRFTGTLKLGVTIDYIGNTNATAGTFAVGTPAEGVIDAAGDIDRYGVSLEAGATYYIRMLGLDSRNGDLANPLISSVLNAAGTAQTITTITDAAGNPVVVGLDHWVKFTPGTAGTYYVVTEGSGADGDFLLTADKDIAGTQATTASLTVGGSVNGFIDEGTDIDWYSITLNANTSYVFKMSGVDTGNGTLANPFIDGIRNAATPTTVITGTSVDNMVGVGRDSVVRLVPTATTTYFINAESSGSTIGSYVLTAALDVGSSTTTNTGTLTLGGSVSGYIDDTTDADWYKITLSNTSSYVFKMFGNDSGNGTLDDPLISNIYSSTGTNQTGLVSSSAGLDSIVRWTPTTSGDYYISAQGGGTDTGSFILTATAEPGGTNATAYAVSLGVAVTGTVDDTTDIDRYSISLTSGVKYRVSMMGADSNNGTLSDPYINGIRNAGGTLQTGTVQDAGGVGKDVEFAFTPTATGTYYIDADSNVAVVGTYKFMVSIW